MIREEQRPAPRAQHKERKQRTRMFFLHMRALKAALSESQNQPTSPPAATSAKRKNAAKKCHAMPCKQQKEKQHQSQQQRKHAAQTPPLPPGSTAGTTQSPPPVWREEKRKPTNHHRQIRRVRRPRRETNRSTNVTKICGRLGGQQSSRPGIEGGTGTQRQLQRSELKAAPSARASSRVTAPCPGQQENRRYEARHAGGGGIRASAGLSGERPWKLGRFNNTPRRPRQRHVCAASAAVWLLTESLGVRCVMRLVRQQPGLREESRHQYVNRTNSRNARARHAASKQRCVARSSGPERR